MAHTEIHEITFVRHMDRALQEKSYKNAVTALIASIASKSLTNRGWSFDEDASGAVEFDSDESPRAYRWTLRIAFNHPSNVPSSTEFPGILFTLYSRAMSAAFGRWTLTEVDGAEYLAPDSDETISSRIDKDMVGYAECTIPEDWERYFGHLYGLAPHISRVRSAIQAAITSQFANRFNVVLVGPPGCGKSDVAESAKRALGDDAVMSIDATAMTAAGLIKELNERDILPRVIIFEEVEKAPESALQPLLGILDQRGEIRKITARGNIQRNTRCLAIATVNDYALFKRMQAGAVASRFSNTVHFSRPSRETLAMILTREVEKVEGNPDWVVPALDYCEENRIDDPREVISICLCGGDDLLSGEFQKMMEATSLQNVE
jgi:hypothetical protein